MSTQQVPLTYEGVLELFQQTREQFREEMRESAEEFDRQRKTSAEEFDRRMVEFDRRMVETDRRMMETDRRMMETDRQMKRTDKRISDLGGRVGDIIESMVKGNIAAKFRAFGYKDLDDDCSQNREFSNKKLGIKGEVDLLMENGDVAVLVEVKTTLETADVRRHIERMEKFRLWADAKGVAKKRYIGAVAGAVVKGGVRDFAHENGMYVIVQSGDAVRIITPPEGFMAKEW